jgi:hypothetical protein
VLFWPIELPSMSVFPFFKGALLFVLTAFAAAARASSWMNDILLKRLDASSGAHAPTDTDPTDYGVDVSTQIHGRLKKDTFQVHRNSECSFAHLKAGSNQFFYLK